MSPRLSRDEKRAETRRALMRSAARVFAKKGYEAASIEEIAEEAGYSHGAVYSNFQGKAELFLAVFEERITARAQDYAAVNAKVEREPAAVRARAFADYWMRTIAADPETFLLTLEFQVTAARNPEWADRLNALGAMSEGAIDHYIAEFERESGAKLPMRRSELALLMSALGVGLSFKTLSRPVRKRAFGDFVAYLFEQFSESRSS